MNVLRTYKMMMRWVMLPALLLLVFASSVQAQKNLARGNKLYDMNLFNEAIPYYLAEIKTGTTKSKDAAMSKLANCYRLTGQFQLAEETYKKIFKRKKKDPDNLLNYAQALKSSAKYAEAAEQFREYAKMKPSDPMAQVYIQSCDSAQKWLDEMIGNEVKNVEVINTDAPDFAPVFYKEGIVFTSSREESKKPFISFNGGVVDTKLDLYYENLDKPSVSLAKPQNLSFLNTALHEGPATFSPDGRKVYFTRTINGKKDKKNNLVLNTLQVFYSEQDSTGKWMKPASAFTFNSEKYSVGHPCLTKDGKRIYFMSDMPGGSGGTDIYYCDLQSNGERGAPVNIGGPVNTFGHELFPYLREDGTLYFSSDTHPGMGKLDIFSAVQKNGKWTNITNLKPPINSIGDDFSIVFDGKHKRGFFASDRFNGKGSDDIYSFITIEPLTLTINGGMFQFPDENLYSGIKYKLVNDATGEEKVLEPENGLYRFTLEEQKKYTLVARKDGFAWNKVALDIVRNTEKEYIEVNVKPAGKPVRVNGFMLEKPASDTLKEQPITGIEVQLKDSLATLSREITALNGFYNFDPELEAGGAYVIIATKEGNPPPVASIECKGRITGDDLPLPGAVVKLMKGDELVEQVKAGSDGSYAFRLAGEGDYTVIASHEGFTRSSASISTKERNGNTIKKDIDLLPLAGISLSGVVKDKNRTLAQTQVTLLKDNKVVDKAVTSADGTFTFSMLPGTDYTVTATCQGYFQGSVAVTSTGKQPGEKVHTVITLDSIVTNVAIEIKNIYYDYDKADIRYSSLPELDKLVTFMKMNPSVVIELSAHTDSRGNDDYNMKLSQARAESARMYLILEDVQPSRIVPKGYGESKPVVPNAATEDQHQQNRRTEFKVIKQ